MFSELMMKSTRQKVFQSYQQDNSFNYIFSHPQDSYRNDKSNFP